MKHIVSRTPLNDGSARRRDLYLTKHTKTYRKTDSHAQVGFEHAIPAYEWPQTHALDRAVTGSASYTLWEHFGIYSHLSVSIAVYAFSVPLCTSQEMQKFCFSIMDISGLDRIIYLGCKTCDVFAVFQFLTLYYFVLSQKVAPSLV